LFNIEVSVDDFDIPSHDGMFCDGQCDALWSHDMIYNAGNSKYMYEDINDCRCRYYIYYIEKKLYG
jgi:hypothetical protein